MNVVLGSLFAVLTAISLAMAAHFYGRAYSARRSLALLGRLNDSDHRDGMGLEGYRLDRLAKTPSLQQALKDAPFVAQWALLLDQAGSKWTVAEVVARTLGYGTAAACALALFSASAPVCVLFGALGGAVPNLQLLLQRRQRAQAFELQLSEAVELIALYLRAGRSLSQAFVAATEELAAPAGEEFAIAAEEYRLGRPLALALRRVAERFSGSLGFRFFAIAVAVLSSTGGNLVEVLERIKKTLDSNLAYQRKLAAMTSEARMSANILSIVPGVFLLMMCLVTDDYFALMFRNPIGIIFSTLFAVTWISGIVWVKRLMNMKADG